MTLMEAKLLQVIQSIRDLTTDCGCDRLLNIREQADEVIAEYGKQIEPIQFTGVKQGPCSDPLEGKLFGANLPAYTPRITGKKD
jgi:hypothetical protein